MKLKISQSNNRYKSHNNQYKQKPNSISILLAIFVTFAIVTSYSINSVNAQQTPSEKTSTLRIGYFPNINHAQAVIGLNNGDYQKSLGNNTKVETFVFNAGPSAIEALLAKRIDATYIGPNPAINGYVVTGGEDVRVIAGASSGGASFIVRNDAGIESVADLGGKKFASPQLGNTQDISLRKYIIDNGFNTVENGGNVTVVAVKPSDIVTLMLKKEIDGAWVPEPWGIRLINEANGKVFVDERDLWPPEGEFVSSNIIVRTDYLKSNPDVIEKLLEAHVDQTQWINERLGKTNNNENTSKEVNFNDNDNDNNSSGIAEVVNAFNDGLRQVTGKTIPENELKVAL
ncbi:MAG TPA: ABC transporter substrate-binding protein, partial [Candidatus Nitrosocosmicus sp.]|nr:ABC transporter substrate-binding protein [Candidatus Nitrosocosmicus sp.]